MKADLRLGRWQDVLGDVEPDALICDPPYSARVHAGHASGAAQAGHGRADLAYPAWTDDDARELVGAWSGRARGWFCVLTDHISAPVYLSALEAAGRYAFAPLPVVTLGARPRLVGDGPASWTVWLVVARPSTREAARWRSLPGAYVDSRRGCEPLAVVGGKSERVMRAIIRDYTRPGDLVVDPCAGAGTTLLAALLEGRRAVGAEVDPGRYEIARRRLAAGFTPPLCAEW